MISKIDICLKSMVQSILKLSTKEGLKKIITFQKYLNKINSATPDIGQLAEVVTEFLICPQVTLAYIYDANLPNSKDDKSTDIWHPILSAVFTREEGYSCSFEARTGKGQADGHVKYLDGFDGEVPRWKTILLVEVKSFSGDGWPALLKQNSAYADKNDVSHITGSYVACIKGDEISFFTFVEDFHTITGFGLKGIEFDGLVGLIMHENGLNILPQYNTYTPQFYPYKLNRSVEDNNSITAILYRMACTVSSLQPDNQISPSFSSDIPTHAMDIWERNHPNISSPNKYLGRISNKNLTAHIDYKGSLTYEQ